MRGASPPRPRETRDLGGIHVPLGAKCQKSRWATNADWSHHKATIKRLYLTENKPLWDVKDIMRTKYSFNATWVIIPAIHSSCIPFLSPVCLRLS